MEQQEGLYLAIEGLGILIAVAVLFNDSVEEKEGEGDRVVFGETTRPLEDIDQLAHVARPLVLE